MMFFAAAFASLVSVTLAMTVPAVVAPHPLPALPPPRVVTPTALARPALVVPRGGPLVVPHGGPLVVPQGPVVYGPSKPYAYEYGVSDSYSGAVFNAKEQSADGGVVSGSYQAGFIFVRIVRN